MGKDRGVSPEPFAFVVTLNDDSMLPRYRRGAVLYIDPSRAPKIGEEVYVETERPALAVVGVLLSRRGAEICVKPYAAAARRLNVAARIGRVVPAEEFLF